MLRVVLNSSSTTLRSEFVHRLRFPLAAVIGSPCSSISNAWASNAAISVPPPLTRAMNAARNAETVLAATSRA